MKQNEGNYRKSGEPAIYHAIGVGRILMGKNMFGVTNKEVITAAILHDYLEDLDKPINFSIESDKLKEKFGESVWRMVNGLTKFKFDDEVQDVITYENVLRVMVSEPGIALIKLADRLHNWETIGGQKKLSKRVEAANETLEFFLPIARKVGLQKVIDSLEWSVNMVRREVETFNFNKPEDGKMKIFPRFQNMVESQLEIIFRDANVKERLRELLGSR